MYNYQRRLGTGCYASVLLLLIIILSINCVTRVTTLPSQCENAADAVFSTPHSCLTTPCPTHSSPAHANVCPIRMHRLILGLSSKH